MFQKYPSPVATAFHIWDPSLFISKMPAQTLALPIAGRISRQSFLAALRLMVWRWRGRMTAGMHDESVSNEGWGAYPEAELITKRLNSRLPLQQNTINDLFVIQGCKTSGIA